MSPNNLHGHNKEIKFSEIYKENLDDTWLLVITLSKEFSNSEYPHVCIKCVVTTGQTKIAGNGVLSYTEHSGSYWVAEDTVPLIFTTKDGFTCEQYVGATNTHDKTIRLDWRTNITPEYLLSKLDN